MNKWKILNKTLAYKSKIFANFHIKVRTEQKSIEWDMDYIAMSNWINIVACTKEGQILLVKQYRVGIDDLTLEIPGGAVDPGEDALEASKRELREETGYTSSNWSKLGQVHPNPAFMGNWCATYLALDCEKTHDQNLDELEEIEVVLKSENEIFEMIKQGQISHSLVIAAFQLYQNKD